MRLTGKTRRQLFRQNVLYYVLLLAAFALLGWAGVRYNQPFDWSAGNRNTLSEASRNVLQSMSGPLNLTVFAPTDDPTAEPARQLIARYRRYKTGIELEFVDPHANPARTRALGVSRVGEVIIEYGGKSEHLQQLTEQNFTNALQRLAVDEQRWVVVLTGHGERDPYGEDDGGLAHFTGRLAQKGFQVQTLNLLSETTIPDNTQVLVIASPRREYLPGEIELIGDYLEKGGNLLWLTEPEAGAELTPLAERLGVRKLPGVVVDAAGQILGVNRPDFVVVVNYPDNAVLPEFDEFTLLPQAAGLESSDDNPLGLEAESFLQTLARSWTETGPVEGQIEYNDGTEEQAGPIDVGLRLTRGGEAAGPGQRVAVIGDGDFLSNAYIGNGGNLKLGLKLMGWLGSGENLVAIEPVSAPDTRLNLSAGYFIAIAVVFLLLLPGAMIGIGTFIWLRRRKR